MIHVSALFTSETMARKAVDDLIEAGFDRSRISVVLSEDTRRKAFPVRRDEGNRMAAATAAGGALGAIIGGIAALASLGIPGGIVVAGPVAAFFGGAGVGAFSGGVIGALAAAGVPEEEARRYEERIRHGDILVAVQTFDATRADLAARTLESAGAHAPPQSWYEGPSRV